ncbi:hypothetical protein [Pseudaeromonas paramecii]|uniref:Resolvase/invertase-type recombinase catalytic domain-containing protein n=1 Tax=Pseudaeromonas paramecii TaxID=2138166 RepID=A0ABP8PWV9_9GAMM
MGKIARAVLGALGAESIQSFDDGQHTRRSLEQECRESGAVVVLFKRRDESAEQTKVIH